MIWDFLAMSAAVCGAGVLRGLTGFGFALAAVPLLSLIVPPLEAVVMAQVLQLVMAPIDLVQNRAHVDRVALARLVLGAVVLVPLGVAVASFVSPDLLRLVIAAVVLAGLGAIISRVKIPDGRGPALAAGGLAGLFAGLAAMPGPPVIAYFLGRGSAPKVTRASSLMFFAFTASVALGTSLVLENGIQISVMLHAVLGLPALLLGTYIGTAIFHRLHDASYRNAAVAVLMISALITGVKGLAGLI